MSKLIREKPIAEFLRQTNFPNDFDKKIRAFPVKFLQKLFGLSLLT